MCVQAEGNTKQKWKESGKSSYSYAVCVALLYTRREYNDKKRGAHAW